MIAVIASGCPTPRLSFSFLLFLYFLASDSVESLTNLHDLYLMLFSRGDVSRCEPANTSVTGGGLAPIHLDGGKHLPPSTNVLSKAYIRCYLVLVSDMEATLTSPAAMLTAFGLHKFTLPIDIILHIIDVGTFDSGDIEDYMLFPLHVSHVCKTWRDLALNTSRLWTTIAYKGHPKFVKMPLVRENKKKPPEYYPLICLFLARSEERPITIHLDLRNPDHDYSVVEADVTGKGHPIDNLLNVLTSHASRIKTLTFVSNSWIDVIQVLRYHLYSLKMPNLEHFELTRAHLGQAFRPTFEPHSLLTRVPFPVQPNGGAQRSQLTPGVVKQDKWPKVKHVALVGVPLAWQLWSFYGLTSLRLNYLAGDALLSAKNMRHVFRSVAPALKHLEIHGSSPEVNDGDMYDQVELPHLQTLSIGFSRTKQVTWLIKSLLTPSLTSLEIVDIFQCYFQYCRHMEGAEPRGDASTRDATQLCSEMLEHMPFPLDKIKHLTLRYLTLGQLGGEDFIPAAGVDDASMPPAARFLLSLPALDTLTLESTDFERLAIHLFRNPARPVKRSLRTLEVLTCSPWRKGFIDENRGVERKTSRLTDGDPASHSVADADISHWMSVG